MNARKRPNSLKQLFVKDFCPVGFVTGRKKIYRRNDDVSRRKSGIGILHSHQASEDQSSPGNEHKTQRHLNEYKHRTQSRSAAATNHSATFTFERARKIDMARLNCRHQREQHGRSDAYDDTQSQNTPVEMSGIINCNSRSTGWSNQHESVAAPVRNHDPTSGCNQREKEAFSEKLFY